MVRVAVRLRTHDLNKFGNNCLHEEPATLLGLSYDSADGKEVQSLTFSPDAVTSIDAAASASPSASRHPGLAGSRLEPWALGRER